VNASRSEEQARQNDHPEGLSKVDFTKAEHPGHQPVPKQPDENAEYQHKSKSYDNPPCDPPYDPPYRRSVALI
jgi:hypothetical protein